MGVYHLYDPNNDVHYCNGGNIDPLTTQLPFSDWEWVEGAPPASAEMWRPRSKKQIIAEGRAELLAQYKAAPLDLRVLFSEGITRVNNLLDLDDFEAALMIANAVDTSVISDPELRVFANELKAQFVQGLEALAEV
jgi:hypothetical protein